MRSFSFRQFSPRAVLAGTIAVSFLPLLLIVLFPARFYFRMDGASYLVFHNVAEFFSIMVSLSIFGVGWHTYKQSKDSHALFLGAAFLSIGIMDFMHAMASAAMPAFITANSTNKSSQFWIAARLISAVAFLLSAYIYAGSKPRRLTKALFTRPVLVTTALALPMLLFAAITFSPSYVPDTFIPGPGLTAFKVYSEYLIVLMLCLAAMAYWKRMRRTGDGLLIYYVTAFIICVASELVFTAYKVDFDVYNVLGHTYKVVAFYLIYRGIFVASVREPYLKLSAMNRRLDIEIAERTQAQDALQAAHAELELRVEERTKALRESEQRFATTLGSIGDAVIATDTDGNIMFMNRVAEDITGWPLGEASGRSVTEIFNIVNESTRHAVESPVARVLREGIIVGLANHTILIRKDGAEVPIDDSGAPIRDTQGRITGVVLVFRDITDRRTAEEALQESETRYRNLFRNITEEVHFWQVLRDEQSRIKTWRLVDANPPTLVTWGKTLDEIKDRTADEIFGPGATDHYMSIVRKIMDEGIPYSFEDYFPNLDKYFRFTSIPLGDYFITTGADVTAVKKAQRTVEERNAELERRVAERTADVDRERKRLYDVLETLPAMICLLTPDHYVAFANRSFREKFGEPKGRHCYETCFGVPEPCEFCESYEVLKTGLPHHWEVSTPDGKSVIDAYDFPFTDIDGSPLILEMDIDITDRKRAEEALRLVGQYNRGLLEASPDPLVTIDDNGKISDVNKATEHVTGCPRDALIGTDFSDYFTDPEKAKSGYETVFRDGLVRDYELAIRHRDGRLTPVLYNASVYRKESGEIAGVFAAARDITDQRRLQDELQQAHKMEAIGTLAGGIAHDFNNIIAAIIGFTEMAIDDVADRPEAERYLQNVLKSGMRARELVKQILAFSRKTERERGPLSLSPVIKETVQLLRASIPATIKIHFSLETASDVVLATPVEVQQVLMNLAANASIAMQEKGGTMDISLADTDMEGDARGAGQEYLQLTIRDTGAGMSPEVMKRIFEPFFTTREVGKGTGMGLAVVYGIVSDLKGTVAVESEPGKGSTFRVLLPKVKVEAKDDGLSLTGSPRGTERILFVDDEEMIVEWGRTALERLGYTVTSATDSGEALRIFSSDPSLFDLVITDHAMPSMSGAELASGFLSRRGDIPIILCTGHSDTFTSEKAGEIGIREYLMKPLSGQELAEAVRRVLGAGSRNRTS